MNQKERTRKRFTFPPSYNVRLPVHLFARLSDSAHTGQHLKLIADVDSYRSGWFVLSVGILHGRDDALQ